MGYILPIQPNQYSSYADRMNMNHYDYADVQRVRPVRMKSLFEEELEEKLSAYNGPVETVSKEPAREHPAFNPKIQQALSREISYVVGKGLQINTYV